jgi:UDP-N-acetylmuramyl pentapeptide phosphotransferase/UDP-N-acetylglucosamine-1-phosphate transferase
MLFYPIVVIVILFAAMLLYIKLADKFNIIDKPNKRSSHNYITVRGGGVIFWLAALLYTVSPVTRHLSLVTCHSSLFFTSLTLLSFVSFWDDISSLSNKIRITVHFLAITLLFYGLRIFQILPWWQIVFAYIFIVGTLNAYNFMDGINGITGLYSLSVLIALQYVNLQMIHFTPPDFINCAINACIVCLFFNYRQQAKCFAGDVGSMAISFWIVTLLLQLMLESQSVIWILFLMVYGVDSIYTIIHRLYLRQNIFQAHRLHFYQILTNDRKQSHLTVSAGYALTQLIICLIIIVLYNQFQPVMWIVGISLLALYSLIYILKFAMLKKE